MGALAILATLAVSAVPAVDTLEDLAAAFADPPQACGLRTFYHWTEDCITEEGFAADFAAMARVGITTAYCCVPTAFAHPDALSVKMLSRKWLDLFACAVREAKAQGVRLYFHNCPGWSASGGPWIKPEDSMKVVVASETDVLPGARAGKLSQPEVHCGFYRDIAVKAFAVDPVPPLLSGGGALHLPFAQRGDEPAVFELCFGRTFSPAALVLRFRQENVNCEGVVEGACGKGDWRRLADFSYHFHFSRAAKILELNNAENVDRLRLTFRANAVPEWQGGKFRDLDVDTVSVSTARRVPDADLKTSRGRHYGYVRPDDPAAKGLPKAEMADLTPFLSADGSLEWTAPTRTDGKVWRILRLGYTSSGKICAPATLPGLECDKLSKRGLDAHWPNMPMRLLSVPGAKDVLVGFYIDSWEAGGQNWTEGFADEFRRRRGYDLSSFLPLYAGYVVDDDGTTAKVLYDVQRTVAELIGENYYGYFTELCRRSGVASSAQAYGGPFDSFEQGGALTVPQGEIWLGDKEYGWSSKVASSVAHVRGRPLVGAEAFTTDFAEGRFQATPHELRVYGDRVWADGGNRIICHSYLHQPLSVRPGMSLGRHGSQLNRNTTWWPEVRHWNDYVRRGQMLLGAGRPMADLLMVPDEGFPDVSVRPTEVERNGWHFDFCSAADLRRMRRFGRGVGLPEGTDWPLVYLAGNRYTTATLRRVRELAAAGVRIAGRRPLDTPSFGDDPSEWKSLADALWAERGPVIAADGPVAALRKCGIEPSVSAARPLLSVRRDLADGTRIFFVMNHSARPFKDVVRFAADGTGSVWKASDGTFEPFNGCLDLPAEGSAFVVFSAKGVPAGARTMRTAGAAVGLSNKWRIVSFDGVCPPDAPLSAEPLFSWSDSPDRKLRYFSGRAVYEREIEAPDGDVVLDLGDVREVANVFVDGRFVACLWESPYRVVLPVRAFDKTVKRNVLRVEVVNTWPNRLIGDARARKDGACEEKGEAGWPKWVLEGRPDSGTGIFTWSNFDWAWAAGDPLRPAGLLGPVRMIPLKSENAVGESERGCLK